MGKSSLINRLLGVTEEQEQQGEGEGLEVGALTRKGGLGAHTTTNCRLLRLEAVASVAAAAAGAGGKVEGEEGTGAGGALVIDSPGIRALHLWHLDAPGLLRAFPEVAAAARQCQFRNCRHEAGQRGCAVREHLSLTGTEWGGIAPSRLQSYFDLLAECEHRA